jgi:hypothetical protein
MPSSTLRVTSTKEKKQWAAAAIASVNLNALIS